MHLEPGASLKFHLTHLPAGRLQERSSIQPGGTWMWQSLVLAENPSLSEVVLLPTDTLLRALRMMEQRRVCLLLVVGEGGVVGLVSRARLLSAWREDPLQPVGRVMAACGASLDGRGGCATLPRRRA